MKQHTAGTIPSLLKRRSKTRQSRYTRRWDREKKAYLFTHPNCEYCIEANLLVPATLVDHIDPVVSGGALLAQSNWAACCRPCHDGWVKTLERGGEYRPAIGFDGALVEPGPLTTKAIEAKTKAANHG